MFKRGEVGYQTGRFAHLSEDGQHALYGDPLWGKPQIGGSVQNSKSGGEYVVVLSCLDREVTGGDNIY